MIMNFAVDTDRNIFDMTQSGPGTSMALRGEKYEMITSPLL